MTAARPVLRVEALTSPRLTVRLTTAPRGPPSLALIRPRRAAAAFHLAEGFTLEDVQNLSRHSSIVLTSNTYGHVLEQRQVAMGLDTVLGG